MVNDNTIAQEITFEIPGKITKIEDLGAPGYEGAKMIFFDMSTGCKGMIWICEKNNVLKVFIGARSIEEFLSFKLCDSCECDQDGPADSQEAYDRARACMSEDNDPDNPYPQGQ